MRHRELLMDALARTEMMKAISRVVTSANAKYTKGTRISAVTSLAITVAVSDIGMDFQNRMLRSLRSAYKQSRRYHVE